jgi:quercetin dioxygenase-like cupin family protein
LSVAKGGLVAANHRVAFDSIAWDILAPGARHKVFRDADTFLRLVEFTHGFVEPDWCVRGHVGYVLAGDLDVDFDGTRVRFAAGDGIFIPPGEGHRHNAVVVSDAVQLVLVEHA